MVLFACIEFRMLGVQKMHVETLFTPLWFVPSHCSEYFTW